MAPVAAAVLPHPPLLVPELAGAAAPELDPLRAACREALSTVLTAADLTLIIGDGPVWAIPVPTASGSFHPYGADIEVALPVLTDLDLPDLPVPARLSELPLSLAVAAQLLANLGPPLDGVSGADRPQGAGRLWAATVPRSLDPRAAAAIGRALNGAGRFGLVVMADLSACRTERAPGAFRPEGADFDARVGDAFRAGAPHRLVALDPAQAAGLLVAGLVPLQVLAGSFAPDPAPGDDDPPGQAGLASARDRSGDHDLAAGPARRAATATSRPEMGAGRETGRPGTVPGVRGRVLYEGAPYGVGYLVALLTAP